jgi:putative ABC transport system permease protein
VRTLRAWRHRLFAAVRPGSRERELGDELEAHLEMHIEDNLRRGLSPQEARRQALVSLGGVEQVKEEYRRQRGLPLLETAWRDLLFAGRLVRRNPAFSVVVFLTLAIGIGANSLMFSVVHTLLLKPLPYANPGRLVAVQAMDAARWRPSTTAPPDYYRFRSDNRTFDFVDAFYSRPFNLTGGRAPERLPGLIVSSSLFRALGIEPVAGRGFAAQDEQWGAHRVVLLTAGLWERRFSSDPSILGRPISLNGEPFTVIGVLPPAFSFLGMDAELFVPMAFEPGDNDNSHNNYFLRMIGRLKPDASPQRAAQDLNAILASIVAEQSVNQGMSMDVIPLRNLVVGTDVKKGLWVLLGAVAFVLLICCANLANLLVARAASRQREITVRLALGASRARLVRQFLVESLMFSFAGGAAGLMLAHLSTGALNLLSQRVLPRADVIRIDATVCVYTALIAMISGVLLGLAPAAYGATRAIGEGIKGDGRGASEGPRKRRLRQALVVVEVALSLVLLAGAGLMIRSMYELLHVPAGFSADGVLTMQLNLPERKYVDAELDRRNSPRAYDRAVVFFDETIAAVRSLPGVKAVGAVNGLPLMGEVWGKLLTMYDRPLPAGVGQLPSIQYRVVAGDYFAALRIRILRGRGFTARDDARAPKVAIINQELARRQWAGGDPIGKTISVNPPLQLLPRSVVEKALKAGSIQPDYQPDRFTIVGVADDVRYGALETTAVPLVYAPYAQAAEGGTNMFLAVRGDGDPMAFAAPIRERIGAIDPDQPVASIRPMSARVAASVEQRRMQMRVLALFAIMAVVLAAVGIYGVMSYSVTERSREMGIRLALGAARRDVLSLMLSQGLRIVAIGLAAGVAGSLIVTRVLRSLLFQVNPGDPLVHGSIVVLLSVVAIVATYLPARRAAGLDPLVILKVE